MTILLGAFSVPQASASSFSTGLIDIDAFQTDDSLPFTRAKNAGTKYVKNNLYWPQTVSGREASEKPGTEAEPFEAKDPGSPYYNWGAYDSFVRHTVNQGLVPVLTITNSPRWARSTCKDSDVCSPNPEDYADFATAAASRYSGKFDPEDGGGVLPRVRYWQAWVEPNLYHFYSPIFSSNGSPVSPRNYKPVLNGFYDAIHGVNNTNVVLAAGLAPNGVKDKAIAPMTFTRSILCMNRNLKNPRPKKVCGAPVKADVWAVHPYTTGAPTHFPAISDNMSVAALPRMVRLINAARRSGRLVSNSGRIPIWVTEFSWDSNKPDPGGLSWNLEARWVAQAMFMMYRANVRTMFWFGLRDEDRGDGKRPWHETFESGLYLRGKTTARDRPKKVLKVFRYPFYAARTKKGFSYWGRTPNGKRARVIILARKKRNGRFVRVAVAKANGNGIFSGRVKRKGFTARGAAQARLPNGGLSVPFGLHKTKDFYQPPHGRNVS